MCRPSCDLITVSSYGDLAVSFTSPVSPAVDCGWIGSSGLSGREIPACCRLCCSGPEKEACRHNATHLRISDLRCRVIWRVLLHFLNAIKMHDSSGSEEIDIHGTTLKILQNL